MNKLNSTKKGAVPIMAGLGIIALLAAFMAVGGFPKLEVFGFSDGYLSYDEFSRDYIDTDNLWKIDDEIPTQYLYTYTLNEDINPDDYSTVGLLDDTLSFKTNSGPMARNLIVTPRASFDGKSFKVKVTAIADAKSGGRTDARAQAKAHVYLNGVKIYTCDSTLASNYNILTTTCVVEGIQSFVSKDLYAIKVNGDDYAEVNVSNPSGDGKLKIVLGHFNTNKGIATSLIDYLRYKHEYNCKIENDEILLFDSYAAGSQVSLDTLSHEPVKFCLDYPVQARSFEEDGIKTDLRGEVLQRAVRGESLTVPLNEEWKVYYISKYTPDFSLRCPIDEAYNTQTGQCENPTEQQTRQCKADSDCYIPPGCTGVTASCATNGSCIYQGSCIFKPAKESTSIWDKILSLSFIQWIQGLWA